MIKLPFPSYSVGKIGWEHASKAFAGERKSYLRKQQYRSFFFAFVNTKFANQWFEILNSADFEKLVAYRPRLYFKPFTAYMSIRWDKNQRIKVILDTYRFIMYKNEKIFTLLTNGNFIEIARLKLTDYVEGVLILGYDERFRKEGELVLSFKCDELGGIVASAAFSFEEIESDRWICRIACIQGHRKNEYNSSKITQKLLHGLRPKSLLVHAIQKISRELGLVGVYGVGDAIQTYRNKHMIHLSQRHKINFDYNSIWTESNGKLRNDGWFELPSVAVRKDMYEIKTSKRALYRRRYAMLDSLSFEISNVFKNI